MENKYLPGTPVQIKTTGEIVTISSVSPGLSQMFYIVIQNGRKKRYKETDLIPYVDRESDILGKVQNNHFENAESFQKYAYYRLFSESNDSNLYSYQGNKIIFNPFQYKPLLKFLSIDSDERLLIADEVGVGKTIESGLIIDELVSRGELANQDSVLIVCPNVLCRKWYTELRTKFMMGDYHIHDGKSLTYMLRELIETGRNAYPHSIVSEQLFRGEKYQELLRQCYEETGGPFIQLLIVDECHHYRNPATNTHKFGMFLSYCSERVIMLSATPFNLRSDDLYNQLHMLNPSLFPDEDVFRQLLAQIRTVNQAVSYAKKDDPESKRMLQKYAAELKQIADRNQFIAGEYETLYEKIISGQNLSVKEKVDFERLAGMMNPIASSFTRTLKRDAIEHRVTRETMTLEVHYSEAEEDLYQSFLQTNLTRYRMLGVNERAFGLILNGLERIAASSIVALEKNIKRYIEMSDDEFIEMFGDDDVFDEQTLRYLRTLLNESYTELLTKIRNIGDNDSKYNTFRQLIKNVRDASGDNKRIIVFSFYTETLKYLRRKLTEDGYKVALMYGKTPDETPGDQEEDGFKVYGRSDIMRDFEDGKYDILLASEVGGEGLDFQFCSSLINYDLPYNPMRIEQRIGRIDRMGQKADKIIIGNLCIVNTIDMVINSVLLSRIAEAEDLVGELEPIIASELAEINKIIITRDFTDEEITVRERELEQRIEKAKQTRSEFEQARYELVNDKGFRAEFEDSIKKSRVSPHESLLFTYSFLKKLNGCWCKLLSPSAASIHVTKDICDRLTAYNKRMNFGLAGEEIRKLVSNNGDLEIDFDGDSAYESKDRVFFKPSGAWIRFMIDYIRTLETDNAENTFYLGLKRNTVEQLKPGRYWLFVYDMEFKGFFDNRTYEYVAIREDNQEIICLDDEQKKALFQEARIAKLQNEVSLETFDEIKFMADDTAEVRKEEISSEAMSKNNVKIGSRIQAIHNLSQMRIRNLEADLMTAYGKEEERIRRAIDKEQRKAAEKIDILQEKMKYVGTYSLDAVCLLDVS